MLLGVRLAGIDAHPKILILLENEPYPYDRRVRYEAEALRDAGYDVTVVSPMAPRAPERETTVDGVRVLRFDAPPPGGGIVGYVREYLLAGYRMYRIVKRLKREPQFAVVVACNPPDFLIHIARPLRRRGAGLIFDLHDPSPELYEAIFSRRMIIRRLLVAVERISFAAADVVMTVNDACADLVRVRGGVAPDRVFVVRNAPDPRRFFPVEPRPELRDGRKHLVLWVGRMSRKEGLHHMIDAAEELIQRQGRTDVTFTLVGDGDVRDDLIAETGRRKLDDAFAFPGMAEDAQLREYMATADVCLSLDEPNPMNDRSLMIKVLEYMAMGRPVVQFPLAEMRKVCGDAAVYAASADSVDLAQQIAALLDDPVRRERLGQAARARVLDGMMWPDQVPILLAAVTRAAGVGAARNRRPTRH
jgi:glycosyltransferase involved in cell wall biosynthesis